MSDTTATLPLQRQWLHPRYWSTWGLVGLLALLAFMPWQLRWWLGKGLGNLLYRYQAKRRAIVQTNLRLCYPHLDETARNRLSRQHLQHYAAAMLDYSVLFFRSRQHLAKRVKLTLPDAFHTARLQQQPIIILLGHSTWLEFAPLALGLHYRAYGSYKPFSNPIFDWLIARSRLNDVELVIPREAGLLRLVRTLTPERLLIFLPDEDLGEKVSVYAPFMGQPKATLTTPARIAQMTHAVCFPTLAFFNADTGYYEVMVDEPLKAYPSGNAEVDATQLNQALEQLIRQHPAQYLWLMKLFKTQPNGERQYH